MAETLWNKTPKQWEEMGISLQSWISRAVRSFCWPTACRKKLWRWQVVPALMDCFPKIIFGTGGCQRWQGRYWFPLCAIPCFCAVQVSDGGQLAPSDPLNDADNELQFFLESSRATPDFKFLLCIYKTRPRFSEHSWLRWKMFLFFLSYLRVRWLCCPRA